MERKTAERITTESMKPIYGFALKRCANIQDAEDLTQEICLKLYRALLVRGNLDSVEKFVWTVAHNALANYYRGKQRGGIGVPIDELLEFLPTDEEVPRSIVEAETLAKLHGEIAHLSQLQRKIVVMYYYENKKQAEIASTLDLPVGTVKWHLFEAKKDLKRGMKTMRNLSELKFNPIRFEICGTSGSVGVKGGAENFFRNALSQNIAYAVWKHAKTINEIAELLGVSPVYVESEVEYLEEYGFLLQQGNKYLANILIDETTTEQNRMQSEMYEQAAKIFANELYDDLKNNGLLNAPGVVYPGGDQNFALWSLIPYIAMFSGEKLRDTTITFEEAVTIRPDGGHNIAYASVLNSGVEPPKYLESLRNWSGPCWNGLSGKFILWTIDTEWSTKRIDDNYQINVRRDLSSFERFLAGDQLSVDEYAYMAERGYLKVYGEPDGLPQAILQIVWIKDAETKQKLLEIGDRIREKHRNRFDELKAPFISSVMESTPQHLRKIQAYAMQHIFYSDGWFLLHCLKELVGNGKLKPPAEDQKQSLTTLVVPNL